MKTHVFKAVIVVLGITACFFFYMYMKTKAELVDVLFTVQAETNAVEHGLLVEKEQEAAQEEAVVTFYICGEVAEPDIYTLSEGSRINDAIELAGGVTEYAALDMMTSIAAEITDGQKIYVPNIDDDIDKINYMTDNSSGTFQSYSAPKDPDVVVNINTASEKELMKIPGVGEATARLIYDYREENGDFQAIEDIMNIPKIGEKTFEGLKKNITVE